MKKKLYKLKPSDEGVAHPAPFSEKVLQAIPDLLDDGHKRILDPFAGIGRIHDLQDMVDWNLETVGIEIEPEWARLHPQTLVGDALNLPFGYDEFDAVVTSPCYGNRLADSHDAKDGSYRRSYKHDLGRDLHTNNSGQMHWGTRYREFHQRAWMECARVLKPGGHLILNISDHIRGGRRIHVASWHIRELLDQGYELEEAISVGTPRMRAGANRNARVDSELLLKFLFA